MRRGPELGVIVTSVPWAAEGPVGSTPATVPAGCPACRAGAIPTLKPSSSRVDLAVATGSPTSYGQAHCGRPVASCDPEGEDDGHEQRHCREGSQSAEAGGPARARSGGRAGRAWEDARGGGSGLCASNLGDEGRVRIALQRGDERGLHLAGRLAAHGRRLAERSVDDAREGLRNCGIELANGWRRRQGVLAGDGQWQGHR